MTGLNLARSVLALLVVTIGGCYNKAGKSDLRSVRPTDNSEEPPAFISQSEGSFEAGEPGSGVLEDAWVNIPQDTLGEAYTIRLKKIALDVAGQVLNVDISGAGSDPLNFAVLRPGTDEVISPSGLTRLIEIGHIVTGIDPSEISAVISFIDASSVRSTYFIPNADLRVEVDAGGPGRHRVTVFVKETAGLIVFGQFDYLKDEISVTNVTRAISIASVATNSDQIEIRGKNLDLVTAMRMSRSDAIFTLQESSEGQLTFKWTGKLSLQLKKINDFIFSTAYGDSVVAVSLEVESGAFDVNGNLTVTSGKVGVGTLTPSSALQLQDDRSQLRISVPNSDGGGGFISSNSDSSINVSAGSEWNGASWVGRTTSASGIAMDAGRIDLQTNASLTKDSNFVPTSRVSVLPNGNVGVGTTAPAYLLDVGGDSNIDDVRIGGKAAFALAVTAACLADTGFGGKFITYSPGTSASCSSACNSAKISGSTATCIRGWTIFGLSSFIYGTECNSADPSNGQGLTAKYCCCNANIATPVNR